MERGTVVSQACYVFWGVNEFVLDGRPKPFQQLTASILYHISLFWFVFLGGGVVVEIMMNTCTLRAIYLPFTLDQEKLCGIVRG